MKHNTAYHPAQDGTDKLAPSSTDEAMMSTDDTKKEPEPLCIPLWPDTGKLLGIGRGLTYEMAKQGKIPTIELGKRLVVPLARLKAMAA